MLWCYGRSRNAASIGYLGATSAAGTDRPAHRRQHTGASSLDTLWPMRRWSGSRGGPFQPLAAPQGAVARASR